jgi:hypothetical protein
MWKADQLSKRDRRMTLHLHNGLLGAVIAGAFAIGLLLPSAVSAAPEQTSTGTLVGAVTCGAEAITPAANAMVSVAAVKVATRTDGGGRFTLTGVPAGQLIRIEAITDPQESSMSSRYNVVTEPGQILDVGSMDLPVCPQPTTPTAVTTDQEMQQRGSPND